MSVSEALRLNNMEILYNGIGMEPIYATKDSAAFDIYSGIGYTIALGETVIIPTNIRIILPKGYSGLILNRSGKTLDGIVVANSPGLIDEDFRGYLSVILKNNNYLPYFQQLDTFIEYIFSNPHGALNLSNMREIPVTYSFSQTINKDERIAQLLIFKTNDAQFKYISDSEFDAYKTDRGEGGFGSTGR